MDTVMIPHLIQATVDVFGTMLGVRLDTGDPVIGQPPRTNVVSTVGFAGSSSGLVTLGCSSDAAREITASLLGLDPGDVESELADAIGEMTNMIAGQFRNRMSDDDGWALTTPFSTIGRDFATVYAAGTQRVVCPFSMGRHALFVELVLQAEHRRPAGRGVLVTSVIQ
jgi:chemotaxis protein CheX